MFGFFGRGNNSKQRNNAPTKSTAEYEPPLGTAASSSPSSINQQNQGDELFGGMTVHSSNYGNTSTYS